MTAASPWPPISVKFAEEMLAELEHFGQCRRSGQHHHAVAGWIIGEANHGDGVTVLSLVFTALRQRSNPEMKRGRRRCSRAFVEVRTRPLLPGI